MNREMLFRAKLKDWKTNPVLNKWVEGFYLKRKETTYCSAEDYKKHPVKTLYFIAEECMTAWGLPNNFRLYEIDPATLCQFTGFTDKNKNKIWENDILNGFEYPFLSEGFHNYFAEVTWFSNCPAFGIYVKKNPQSSVGGISEGNTEFLEEFNGNDWEVIGNVFDNPEL